LSTKLNLQTLKANEQVRLEGYKVERLIVGTQFTTAYPAVHVPLSNSTIIL